MPYNVIHCAIMAPVKSASLGGSIARTSNYKLPVLKINYLNNMEEQRQGHPVRGKTVKVRLA